MMEEPGKVTESTHVSLETQAETTQALLSPVPGYGCRICPVKKAEISENLMKMNHWVLEQSKPDTRLEAK